MRRRRVLSTSTRPARKRPRARPAHQRARSHRVASLLLTPRGYLHVWTESDIVAAIERTPRNFRPSTMRALMGARLHGLRRPGSGHPMGSDDHTGSDVRVGSGDPVFSGDTARSGHSDDRMGSGDYMGSVVPMGPGDRMGYSGRRAGPSIGSDDQMGPGNLMTSSQPGGTWSATLALVVPLPRVSQINGALDATKGYRNG